jgi:thioredoxin reductase (NADPH)
VSARIENYFGFPIGLSGQELTSLGFTQATKFGAEFAIPAQVVRLDCHPDEGPPGSLRLELDDGRHVSARTVGRGIRCPIPPAGSPGLESFEGRGVSYWASPIEAHHCRGQDVVLVGGGNSAGQAAVFLSGYAVRVLVLVRGGGLSESMSRYLVDRIAATPNIHVQTRSELSGLEPDESGDLGFVRWKSRETGIERRHAVGQLFLFVGADPATEWLASCDVALDAKGFVKTGPDLSRDDLARSGRRTIPFQLETNVPGIFAVGDVRSGSVKRVGGAIGEGAAVVAQLHAYLAEVPRANPPLGASARAT